MNKEDFIGRYEHEFEGWMYDAICENRRGGELSLFMKAYRSRVRVFLGKVFEDKLEVLKSEEKGKT